MNLEYNDVMLHIPVLLKETLEYLNVEKGKKFVDATVGSGGHLLAILSANPDAEVLGIDLDQTSLDSLQTQAKLVQGNYKDIDQILYQTDFAPVDGILLDLGFSSVQVDDPARGFSFLTEGEYEI